MLIKYNAEPTASLFHKDNSFVRGIMGPIGCLPSYTEFLTPHGWKSIDNFTDGDLVAGYDMQSACVQYVKPLDYIKKSATQWVVLQSKSSTFKLVMSDDHYMPVTSRCVGERPGINVHDRQYTKVDALTLAKVKGQKRLLSCYFINDRSPCDIVPTPLIQYAVALNADGHIPKDTQQCATFGFNKERKARRLMLILDELKSIYPDMRYSYKTYALHGRKAKVSDTHYVIRVRNAPYLGKTFDSPFFWQMGGSELRVLVDELVHWDGHLRGATGYEKKLVVFDTSRESDVGFIQYAANACGYRSTVTVAQPTSTRHSALYRVALISPGSIKHPMCLRKGYVSSSIVDGSTTDPQYGDGYKYCFTMPTGYFLIRQHGQVFVSSNSGKSCACCLEILQRALKQTPAPDGFRYSRWAIIRNSYPELKSTTIKTWQDWIPEDICQIKWDAPINAKMRLSDIGDGTGIDMEVIFLALDRPQDVKKLLSLELTGAWINEAKEIDRGVLSMLTGRVGRYPSKSKMDGKKYWSGIIMDTNPMDEDHWYYHLAEEERPVGYRFFRQPGALLYRDGKYVINPLAENIKNHTLGYDYYTRQVPGKDHEWIKVYLMGEYGAVMDGKPVYSEYSDMVHCPPVDVMPLEKVPITVALDFGLTPACVIGQLSARGQLIVLDELVSENMGIRQFAGDVLLPLLSTKYSRFSISCVGDPAGIQRSQSNEATCMDELRNLGLPTEPAHTNDFTARREAVAGFLNKMIDGQPGFILSQNCRMLRKGFLGGYCYRRVQVSGQRFRDKPDKNEYSHPHDALQYLALSLTEQRNRIVKASKRMSAPEGGNRYNRPMDDIAGY